MSNRPQLASEAELAEAGEWNTARTARTSAAVHTARTGPAADQRHAASRTRDGKRYREVDPRLLDPDTADHVHEYVGGAEPDPGVAPEDSEHARDAVAVEARNDAPGRHQL
jgi:hypothetical protein